MNPFEYAGREYDSEIGTYFYRARYYDQAVGRFVVEDPINFGGGTNFYRYVKNNPVLHFDPFGRTCSCTYYQTTGRMVCVNDLTGNIAVNAKGYSGSGLGLNNPALESVPFVGPLPAGFYSIAPSPTNRKGPDTLTLTPWSTTDVYDRYGFLIHGDNRLHNHSGSTGCIVLGPNDRGKLADCGGGSLLVQP